MGLANGARRGCLLLDFGAYSGHMVIRRRRHRPIRTGGSCSSIVLVANVDVVIAFSHVHCSFQHKFPMKAAQGRGWWWRRLLLLWHINGVQIWPHQFSYKSTRRGDVIDISQVERGSWSMFSSVHYTSRVISPLQLVGEVTGGHRRAAATWDGGRRTRSTHNSSSSRRGLLLGHQGIRQDEVKVQKLIQLLCLPPRHSPTAAV